MSVQTAICKGATKWVRRCYMKRVLDANGYETDWQEITPYVIEWGKIKQAYGDEIALGKMELDGWTMKLDNSTRKFNPTFDPDSLFANFRTQLRTKIKISLNVFDTVVFGGAGLTSNELNAFNFYGYVYKNPTSSEAGEITFDIAPMLKIFQEETAYGVSVAAGTTADMVARLVKREVNGVRLFDRYFEGATDADKYKINVAGASVTSIATPIVEANKKTWDKLSDYSIIDNFVLYVDQTGALVWEKKQETATTKWYFNGAGDIVNAYGVNILKGGFKKATINETKIITRAVIEYADNSFAISEQVYTPNDGSPRDIYGAKEFEYKNYELAQPEAQIVADNARSFWGAERMEYEFETQITPILLLNDTVQVNYTGAVTPNTGAFTLDFSLLDGNDTLGYRITSIDIRQELVKIISMEHDLDDLKSSFVTIKI